MKISDLAVKYLDEIKNNKKSKIPIKNKNYIRKKKRKISIQIFITSSGVRILN